jgi:glycosyltransferase involved in cell wall biosynthesis
MIVFSDLRWPDKTGIGVVKQEILRRVPASIEIVDLAVKGSIGSPYSPVAISSALTRRHARQGVFWSPGFVPPAYSRIPSIVTVHDLTHLHFYSRFHVAYYNWMLRRLYQKCAKIVCVSEFTSQEFVQWSGIPSKKVTTIHNGVSDAFRDANSSPHLPFPYVLYPGNHRSYKNTDRLLLAYANSALPRSGIHLVFTGAPQTQLQSKGAKLGVSDLVHFVGEVTDAAIINLYKGALLVAFVSLYEGFGLPIVEAMRAGVPVLTSNAAAMPEVAGDAAILIDPYSVDSIVDGLNLLAFDIKKRGICIQLGHERAKLFSWDVAAAKLWAMVNSADQEMTQK